MSSSRARVVKTIAEMRDAVGDIRRPLGLVPTMGALHEGHLALVRRARTENATLAVSIFVNPAQFAPHEDYGTYPRNLEHDLALLGRQGVDLVFAPTAEEMYPPGFDTSVEVGRIGQILEGKFRRGHFRGVATVVLKLFNIGCPDRAYFGQKDGQQYVVVRHMVEDLNLGVEIVVVPTERERDGLASSSRNASLKPQERRAAAVVSEALFQTKELWKRGVNDAGRLRRRARRILKAEPLVAKIDYVSIADAETLQELKVADRKAMVSTAVTIGPTRLIDNVLLEPQEDPSRVGRKDKD